LLFYRVLYGSFIPAHHWHPKYVEDAAGPTGACTILSGIRIEGLLKLTGELGWSSGPT